MSRASEWISSIPFGNLCIVSICSILYIHELVFASSSPHHHFTSHISLCPRNIIYLHEYYRFITSSFYHGGFMHILMNMASTIALGSSLERRFGSLRFIITVLWGIILTSTLYTLTAFLLYHILQLDTLMYQQSIGFSSVLFQLCVLESNLNPQITHRNFFGLFHISSSLYPWALLFGLQFILPNISFMGHLSGIIIGTLQLYGLLDYIFIPPTDDYLRDMETKWFILRPFLSHSAYLKVPPSSSDDNDISTITNNNNNNTRTPAALWTAMKHYFGIFISFLIHFMDCIRILIFGRGTRLNTNIQLPYFPFTSASNTTNNNDDDDDDASVIHLSEDGLDNDDDDDDWVGLPPISSTEPVESRLV